MTDRSESPTSPNPDPDEGSVRFAPPSRPQPQPTVDPTPTEPDEGLGETFLEEPMGESRSRWNARNRDELADRAETALKAAVSGRGSSQASIDRAAAGLSPTIGALLQGAGMVVHARRTPGGQRLVDQAGNVAAIWVPTDDEAHGVAVPLARIAARHMPEGMGEDNDLSDALGAVLATGLFTIAQIAAERAWRAQVAATHPAGYEPPAPDAEAAPPPGTASDSPRIADADWARMPAGPVGWPQ